MGRRDYHTRLALTPKRTPFALRHYGSYLKATDDPRAIVPEDPSSKRSPGDCKDTYGYMRPLVATVTFRLRFGKWGHGPKEYGCTYRIPRRP
jgi:hypothetical protein